jgi:hypothetical protein
MNGDGDFGLAVLDASGASVERAAMVGLPALAACADAAWHRGTDTVPAEANVLIILGEPLTRLPGVVRSLKMAGKTVAVTFAESGSMPMTDLITSPEGLTAFLEVCRLADAAVATSTDCDRLFRNAGVTLVEFVPTPCPVEDPSWDRSIPPEMRRGILVGTGDFLPHYRNHTAALLSLRELAVRYGEPVTVMCKRRLSDRRMVRQVRRHWPRGLLRIVPAPRNADEFAGLMAAHKLVIQFEWGGGAGDVAAMALLSRIPCVGGHGTVEQIAFPHLAGFGRSPDELLDLAADLLGDASRAESAVARALALAAEQLSPQSARSRLARLLAQAQAARHEVPGGRAPARPR